jgi:multidrug efflux pump subunit AcrA (membrane-fusion protein)
LERGKTVPSDQGDLYFPVPGVVSKVMVKAGMPVKTGQLLAQQDDREDRARLAVTMGELATAKLQIKAAEADVAVKKVELQRIEKLYADVIARGQSNSEIDKARVEVQVGEIAVDYRKGETATKNLEALLAKVKVDQRQLLSPIDGVVAKVDIHAGEGTDLNKPVGLLVVKTDPLWVEVNVRSDKAQLLAKWMTQSPENKTLKVQYVDGGPWMDAQILLLADVANPGANVRMVRLEMPNPGPAAEGQTLTKREAGLQVLVKLPDEVTAAFNAAASGVAGARAQASR